MGQSDGIYCLYIAGGVLILFQVCFKQNMIWFVICYDTSVNILYHLGVVFIKLPLICHFWKEDQWLVDEHSNIGLLDVCYMHDTCYFLSSNQMQ